MRQYSEPPTKVRQSEATKFNNIDINNVALVKNDITDSEWLKLGFMLSTKELGAINSGAYKLLFKSTADVKMHDAGFGNARTVNPKPQFTRYCDPRRRGRRSDRNKVTVQETIGKNGTSLGQGRYWSEAYDDNAQHLMLTPSLPHFQSLFTFISRAVDLKKSNTANKGSSTGFMYMAGQVVGGASLMLAFPVLGAALYLGKFLLKYTSSAVDDSYYTAKPALDVYWSTVNTLVTFMATNIGLLPTELMSKQNSNELGKTVKLDAGQMNELKLLAPDIFTNDNYIDVFALSNRLPRLISKQLNAERKIIDDAKKNNMTIEQFYAAMKKHKDTPITPESTSFTDFINGVKAKNKPKDIANKAKSDIKSEGNLKDFKPQTREKDGGFLKTVWEEVSTFFSDSSDVFQAATSLGSQFVTFDIDHIGSTTDSFSNTFKDIPTKAAFNSASQSVRDINFSMAGGNVLGDPVKAITDGVGDVISGFADGVTAGFSNVIHALMNGGLVDMPQMWGDSSTNVATHTFKTTLISPYGHPIASLQNLYIPLACILALVLPQNTGRHSHTAPLLVRAYLRGLVDIKLGMLKDLSITRGSTNLSYTKDYRPLSLDISFSITDLSNMVSSPVSSGAFGAVELQYDDVNPLNRYLNAITGQDIAKASYLMPKLVLAASRAKYGADSYFNINRMSQAIGSTFIGDISLFAQENNQIDTLK